MQRRAVLAHPSWMQRPVSAVLLALWCAGCGLQPAPASLTLGATLPLSSDKDVGAAWQRGYQRAVDEANEHGGIRLARSSTPTRVVLEVRDDASDVARAQAEAETLFRSGALLLLATPGLVRMAAQAAVAARHERPYVIPSRAAPDLLATEHPWAVVVRADAEDDEALAYQVARGALDALGRARGVDGEAIRFAFTARTGTESPTAR